MSNTTFRMLFVCTGNICRSPTAHAVMREKLNDAGLSHAVEIDSAGTHGYHIGDPPDRRSMAYARGQGVEMDDLRARRINPLDFQEFDLILAMDRGHYQTLKALHENDARAEIELFLKYAPELWQHIEDVPDPYYGDGEGFKQVYDMISDTCDELLKFVKTKI